MTTTTTMSTTVVHLAGMLANLVLHPPQPSCPETLYLLASLLEYGHTHTHTYTPRHTQNTYIRKRTRTAHVPIRTCLHAHRTTRSLRRTPDPMCASCVCWRVCANLLYHQTPTTRTFPSARMFAYSAETPKRG